MLFWTCFVKEGLEGSFIRCGQQTLSLKNASFHVLRVAILIYKFHAAYLYPVYIQDYV
jgi:hypothetical protein